MKIHTDELLRSLERAQSEAFKTYRQASESIHARELQNAMLNLGRYVAYTEAIQIVHDLELS